MSRSQLVNAIARLFEEASAAHREASATGEGRDPDWVLWYADHLRPRIAQLLGHDMTCTDLVRVIADADEEHQVRAPDTDWRQYYARYLVDRCADDEAGEELALYYYPSCGFCRRVTRVIDELGVDVQLRNIFEDPEYRRELIAARGRATVPVLRCTSEDEERWMPESRDIVRYLQKRFG